MRAQNGFTFIELMIVIALIAVIAAWAVPSFMDIVAENSVASSSNSVLGFLHEARSSAIQQGKLVYVSPVTSPVTSSAWSSGMAAWTDDDNNGVRSNSETLFIQQSFGNGLTLTGPTQQIAFHATGLADLPGGSSFTLCSTTSGISGTQIDLTKGGQASSKTATTCP
jgi:type IV fimbrial biogenesis protein FimT